jgi:N-acetylmuramoyl-L-alanine amidase
MSGSATQRRFSGWLMVLVSLWAVSCVAVADANAGPALSSPRAHLARPPSVRAASQRLLSLDHPTAIAAGTAPGTCLAFGPVQGPGHATVFVDPGHGGVDYGGTGTTTAGVTVKEKTLTLATGLDLLVLLRAAGYRVVMSRIDDTLLLRPQPGDLVHGHLTATGVHHDLLARVACANAAYANILVSIHFNAFHDPRVNGAETLYDSARPFRAANLRLALLVQHAVVAQLRARGWAVPDRGVLDDTLAGTPALSPTDAAYGHLVVLGPAARGYLDQPSAMPGVLCEPLFLTHPAEADVAASVQGQQAIAQGLTQAITAYFQTSRG